MKSPIEVTYIVMELVTGGEIFHYLAYGGPFSDNVCKHIFKQIIEGIYQMHSFGFRDRKYDVWLSVT